MPASTVDADAVSYIYIIYYYSPATSHKTS